MTVGCVDYKALATLRLLTSAVTTVVPMLETSQEWLN
jgi:hypothetical protein